MTSPHRPIVRHYKWRSLSQRDERLLQIYQKEIKKFTRLSAEEEQLMGHIVFQAGSLPIRNHLIESNLWLGVYLAREYSSDVLSEADILQEINLIFTQVATQWQQRGFRFSTFASACVRLTLPNTLFKYGGKIPVASPQYSSALKRALILLEHEFGRKPTIKELYAWLHESGCTMSESNIMARLNLMRVEPIRLNRPIHDGDEERLAIEVIDNGALAPDQILEAREALGLQLKRLYRLLSSIPLHNDTERNVFIKRYGLDEYTLLSSTYAFDQVSKEVKSHKLASRAILQHIWREASRNGVKENHNWLLTTTGQIASLVELINEPVTIDLNCLKVNLRPCSTTRQARNLLNFLGNGETQEAGATTAHLPNSASPPKKRRARLSLEERLKSMLVLYNDF